MRHAKFEVVSKDVEAWETIKSRLRISRAENDILIDEDEGRLIDLFSGNGTVWLGHANRKIVGRVAAQLEKVWITGGLVTRVHLEAVSAIESLFPPSHRVGGLYSTGMEAAEFAIRVARHATG